MEPTTYGRLRSSLAEELIIDDSTKPRPSGNDKQSFSASKEPGRPSTDLNTDPKKWQCCCCCHVRKVVIVMCVLRLILVILGLFALFHQLKETDDSFYDLLKQYVMSSRKLLQMVNNSSVTSRDSSVEIDGNSDLLNIPENITSSEHVDDLRIKYSAILTAIAVCLITIVITSMTLYGAVKIKPKFMLPYIIIEKIIFVIECGIFVIGVIVLCFSQHWLLMIALPFAGLKILFDGYIAYIFWRCYKFCKLQREVISTGGFLSAEMKAGKF